MLEDFMTIGQLEIKIVGYWSVGHVFGNYLKQNTNRLGWF